MGRSGTSYVRDDDVKGERSVFPIVCSQASWLPQVRVGRRPLDRQLPLDGFPLATCTTRADIGDAFEPGDHLSRFGGNPVSCAAAVANIDYLLENRLADEANRKGKYLLQRLRELLPKHKLIGGVRGLGLMVGVELVKDQKLKTPAPSEATKIRELALNKGLLLGHGGVKGNTVRIQPPLAITEEQLEKTVQMFDECLRETH